jgi:hypothetical protein
VPFLKTAVETYTLPGVPATIPIKLSGVCRLFHTYVTGPKARKERALSEPKLREAWDGLQRCWDDLDKLLRSTPGNELEDVEIFVTSWKVNFLVFDVHHLTNRIHFSYSFMNVVSSHYFMRYDIDANRPYR